MSNDSTGGGEQEARATSTRSAAVPPGSPTAKDGRPGHRRVSGASSMGLLAASFRQHIQKALAADESATALRGHRPHRSDRKDSRSQRASVRCPRPHVTRQPGNPETQRPSNPVQAAGSYVQSGSAAKTSPVIDQARAREPPQRSRNSQRPHLPCSFEVSRSDTNRSLDR